MLNRKVFEENLQKLISVFPKWEIKHEDPKCIDTWYNCFENMEDEIFVKMVNEYIKRESKPPTVAGLLDCTDRRLEF